jgi:hypothetical protein
MSWLPSQIGPFSISTDHLSQNIKIELSDLQGFVVQMTVVSLSLEMLWAAAFKPVLVSSAGPDVRVGGKKTISHIHMMSSIRDGQMVGRDFLIDTIRCAMKGMLMLQLAKVVYNGQEGVNRRFKPVQF